MGAVVFSDRASSASVSVRRKLYGALICPTRVLFANAPRPTAYPAFDVFEVDVAVAGRRIRCALGLRGWVWFVKLPLPAPLLATLPK